MTRHKVVVEHDDYPDHSWLAQSHYDPTSQDYEPTVDEDGVAYDPEWYRDPDNHVALLLTVYRMTDEDDDWKHVDCIGGIDFLTTTLDWTIGTFYRYDELASFPYLQQLALDIIGPDWQPTTQETAQ